MPPYLSTYLKSGHGSSRLSSESLDLFVLHAARQDMETLQRVLRVESSSLDVSSASIGSFK